MLELYKIKKAGRDYEHPLGQLKNKRLFSGEKKKFPTTTSTKTDGGGEFTNYTKTAFTKELPVGR